MSSEREKIGRFFLFFPPSVSLPGCMVTAESRTKKKKIIFECVNTHQPTGWFFFWAAARAKETGL